MCVSVCVSVCVELDECGEIFVHICACCFYILVTILLMIYIDVCNDACS